MIDELEIEKSVDNVISVDTNKKLLSHGILTKAMILNGLGYVNKQLYLTPQFFKALLALSVGKINPTGTNSQHPLRR